jgi:hypothetical protein
VAEQYYSTAITTIKVGMEMSHWKNSITEEFFSFFFFFVFFFFFLQIHYLTAHTSTNSVSYFASETRSGTLPGYRHNQDKYILGSGPHMMKFKVLLNNITRKITHSKLLPVFRVLKVETTASIIYNCHHMK